MKIADIINCLNDNQGFVMILLTLAYVITTIFILLSNRKALKKSETNKKRELISELHYHCQQFVLYSDKKYKSSIEAQYNLLLQNFLRKEKLETGINIVDISFIQIKESIEAQNKIIDSYSGIQVKLYEIGKLYKMDLTSYSEELLKYVINDITDGKNKTLSECTNRKELDEKMESYRIKGRDTNKEKVRNMVEKLNNKLNNKLNKQGITV